MTPDFNALTAAVYSRIKDDPDGQAFRDYLVADVDGVDGATRVIPAEEMEEGEHPDILFVAFRSGAIVPTDREIYQATFIWWFYDATTEGNWRINDLITLLVAAYSASRLRAHRCLISAVEFGTATEGREDSGLHLWTRSLQLNVTFG